MATKALAYSAFVFTILTTAAVSMTEYTFRKADPKSKITYHSPAICPDGRTIAYVRAENWKPGSQLFNKGENIYFAVLSNGHWKHRLLISESDSPVWSPDGLLAFDHKGVAVYDPHTGRITQLTRSRYPKPDDSDEAQAYYHHPLHFSPDGRYLVYNCEFYESGDFRIYDSKLHKDLGIDIGNRFAWSSDGTRLVAAWDWYMDQKVPTRLIMWNIKSRKWRTMLRNYRIDNIVWPNGKDYAWVLIVDVLKEGPGTDLRPPQGPGYYRFDFRTRKLTKVSGITQWIVPSPDYRRFVFQSGPKDKAKTSSLYIGETGNWQFRLLAGGVAAPWDWLQQSMYVGWSLDGKTLAYTTKLGDIRIIKL